MILYFATGVENNSSAARINFFASVAFFKYIYSWTYIFCIMWKEEENKLKKTFQFKNFVDAFAFMTKVAIEAERMNHHPWWANVYNRVEIELNTHDAGNIVTEKDRKLAAIIDKLANFE